MINQFLVLQYSISWYFMNGFFFYSMNGFVLASLALVAISNIAQATFVLTTGTAATTVGTSSLYFTNAGAALAVGGGILLLKGLALGALALAASRNRRAALEVEDTNAAFSVLATNEPAQCYRRLICDLATGAMPKSDNDVILALFKKDTSIESPKFEFATAAKLGKMVKDIQLCEVRYSCPLTGEQINNLLN